MQIDYTESTAHHLRVAVLDVSPSLVEEDDLLASMEERFGYPAKAAWDVQFTSQGEAVVTYERALME